MTSSAINKKLEIDKKNSKINSKLTKMSKLNSKFTKISKINSKFIAILNSKINSKFSSFLSMVDEVNIKTIFFPAQVLLLFQMVCSVLLPVSSFRNDELLRDSI